MKYLRYTSPAARVIKTTLTIGSLYLMSAEGSIVATFTFFTIQNGLQT
ncbi:MAG: hypothetical protein DMENIID0002_08410 [Rickettsia endosymbiont of Sergentomyia squamirostris]|uniref:Uncharacterized protein n=1 Tax=Candidatus Tisiphia endosymbiont of Sergentomyia squamirostris TaxID=3113639 RepID=A0AAT9G8R8_9RICK